jgi:putative acetyltransferase
VSEVVVRPYVAPDAAGVAAVVTSAFGDEGPLISRLVTDLRATEARAELVAESDDAVVGHVLLSRSWVDARPALVEVLVLSPLSVAPDHQRRGTGTRLLSAAVAAARSLGVPAVFLEGDPGYYGARGWSPATPLGFTRPSTRIPEPAFQVVVLEGREDWMRGALVYCQPFWAHDCVGLRDPLLASLEHTFD